MCSTTATLRIDILEGRDVPATLSAVGGGFGESSRVVVYDTATQQVVGDFLAFGSTFTGGTSVAVVDVNRDGQQDVIVAAGPGGGPRIRVFDGRAFDSTSGITAAPRDGTEINSGSALADFFAFESGLRGGTFVTGGNLVGSGNGDVIVGAGSGGAPRVRVFDGLAITNAGTGFSMISNGAIGADFFAGDSSTRNGVVVAFGGRADNPFLAVSSGAGGSNGVRVFNGSAIASGGVNFDAGNSSNILANFSTGTSGLTSGSFVTSTDVNSDSIGDLIVLNRGVANVFDGNAVMNTGTPFTGLNPGDVLNTFTIPPGNLINGGFSNLNTAFPGPGGLNQFSGFSGLNNLFGNLTPPVTPSLTAPTSSFNNGIALPSASGGFDDPTVLQSTAFISPIGFANNPTAGLGNSLIIGQGNSFTSNGSLNSGTNPSNNSFSSTNTINGSGSDAFNSAFVG